MKKILVGAVALLVLGVSANAAMSYECWAYKNGSPWKMVNVTANSKSEAVDLAWDKFKGLDINPQSVDCK